jgi:NAD+ kinase
MKIALFGGSFNPPGSHHREIAARLAKDFDQVIILPCGPRPDKPLINDVEPIYRAAMVDMAFRGMDKVSVDLFDLESATFTRTNHIEEMFRDRGELWHVIGADLVKDGAQGESPIQRQWVHGHDIWKKFHWIVITRPGYPLEKKDLPPQSKLYEIEYPTSSSEIRDRLFKRQPTDDLLFTDVLKYIERHGLYRGNRPNRSLQFVIENPRPMYIVDEYNSEAQRIAASFPSMPSENPNMLVVVGGDGSMLRAIRKYWRMRLPFYGVNAGHLGFLLNDRTPGFSTGHALTLHQLPLVRVEIETESGEKRSDVAFNDAWVERATGQTAWIRVSVGGQVRINQLMADAALVSTAAGSASYARAMGAQPMPLNTSALLLVGSNVLKPIGWKAAVLPLHAEIQFDCLDEKKRPLNAYIDGVPQGRIRKFNARISNTAAVELLFEPEHDPAEKLARIQFT